MVLRDVKKGIAVLLGIAVLSFSITGCGGGGSDGSPTISDDNTPIESEAVTITPENSEKVIVVAVDSTAIGNGLENGPSFKSIGSIEDVPMLKNTQLPALEKVLAYSKDLNIISYNETEACPDSGSITSTFNDNGTGGTLTYNECTSSGLVMDGSILFTFDEEGMSGTIRYTDFSITYTDSQFNHTLVYTDVVASYQWDMNGVAKVSTTINAYAILNEKRTEYKDYKVETTIDINNNTRSMIVSGSIKSDCLGGWIEITTNKAILSNTYDICPSDGEIVIIGNDSSLTVTFDSGGIEVSGSHTYSSESCYLNSGVCDSL